MLFALVDLSNLFHRARHGAMTDAETKLGLAQQILFRSLRKLHRSLKVDHIVFAVDHGSWRTSIYPNYKARRKLERSIATPREQRESQMFFEALDNLNQYLTDQTRCTVLCDQDIEADDFIARWIMRHPNDEHLIVSGDSDFIQLLAPNVRIVDANQRIIGVDAVTDEQGHKLAFDVNPKDGKIRIGKYDDAFQPEQNWWRKALFIKLIRGDPTDSIFAAYPGVRYIGKKCSIRAAWEDTEHGYDWNNLMCQSWHKLIEVRDGERITKEVRVSDEFRINESLIDLTRQPDWIIQRMDRTIDAAVQRQPVMNTGIHFLRFCTKNDLPELAKEASDHVAYLNSSYGARHD